MRLDRGAAVQVDLLGRHLHAARPRCRRARSRTSSIVGEQRVARVDQVVAEQHRERLVADVPRGAQHGVAEPERVALADVVHVARSARLAHPAPAGRRRPWPRAPARARSCGRSGPRAARLLRPVIISTSLSPAAAASSTTYWIAGLSTTGSISLGVALVAGRNRVPRPAAGIDRLGHGRARRSGRSRMPADPNGRGGSAVGAPGTGQRSRPAFLARTAPGRPPASGSPAVEPCCGKTATPIDTVMASGTSASVPERRRDASRRRSARRAGRRRRSSSRAARRRTPRRRTGRRCRPRESDLCTRCASSRSTSSPRAWPCRSLTRLKWSRSSISTASGRSNRMARSISRARLSTGSGSSRAR